MTKINIENYKNKGREEYRLCRKREVKRPINLSCWEEWRKQIKRKKKEKKRKCGI